MPRKKNTIDNPYQGRSRLERPKPTMTAQESADRSRAWRPKAKAAAKK